MGNIPQTTKTAAVDRGYATLYDGLTHMETKEPDGQAHAARALAVGEAPPQVDPEWEETFLWSYGSRLWNVGCG